MSSSLSTPVDSLHASGDSSSTLIGIIVLAVILGISVLIMYSIAHRRKVIAEAFMEDFHMPVPNHIRVSLMPQPVANEEYSLAYPRWAYGCKDGSRDRRYRRNMLIRPQSVLLFSRWKMECDNPVAMNDFVIGLRQAGHSVPLCMEERQKQATTRQKAEDKFKGTSAVQLYARFMHDSDGFEEWCANLIRKTGAQVRVTPSTNDGGYDLDIFDKGVRTLAECKCYHPSKGTVGRPLLQKLVGANATEHAQQLMFMTTGRYSAPAVAYANEQGITLMSGSQLVALDMATRPEGQTPRVMLPDEWFLTQADIMKHYPPDYMG